MSKLRLAPTLTLPLDAVTQAIGILAKRRVGKSYTARRFAEQLFKAGQQIVIVDPKGDWWGIRSSADGKKPGLPVVILGGERGDIPLEVGGGEVVARLVAEERVSVLLDLSLFRKREVATFMTAFLEGLYRLKAREAFRTPLMLIIDEADAIAPQKPQENEARMLGAAEDIVRRGGQRGIGCTMITQRSAVLNKNVLTQVEMLVALRTIAPQDLKAMDAWIEVHGERDQRDTLMESLPSLPQGDAWFWSPGWPTADGLFARVHVLPIETFDSGASPKPGQKRVEPKNLADVDLGALTKSMAATIAKQKADDPKELRKEIARLTKELAAKAPATVEKPVADPRVIERAVLAAVKPYKLQLARLGTKLLPLVQSLGQVAERMEAVVLEAKVLDSGAELDGPAARPEAGVRRDVAAAGGVPVARRPIAVPRPATSAGDAKIGKTGAKILGALAFYQSLGKAPTPASMVAAFVGMSASGGSWGARLSELRQAGYVVTGTGTIALTDEGAAVADASGLPSTLDALHDVWRAKLGGKARAMLDVLIAAYPQSVTKADLAAAIDMEMAGGSFGARLSEVRAPGLLDDAAPRGEVRASDVLFPEGL